MIKGRYLLMYVLFLLPAYLQAQQIFFSKPLKEDAMNMNFDILGKMNGNILVFKNVQWKYELNVFSDSMELKDKVALDFLPGKTIHVDYVAYPDFFYLIYQHQKKGVLYCMAVKMDFNGKKLNEPVQLDTTQVGSTGDNKIYATITSEDKKKIMVFKIQRKDDKALFATLLFDSQRQLLHKSRLQLDYDDSKDAFSDFSLDNEGNFIFAASSKNSGRENQSRLSLIIKPMEQDTFTIREINLDKAAIDEVKIKIDNVNKRYILSSLFYKDKSENIDGVFFHIRDAMTDAVYANVFTVFSEALRAEIKSSAKPKTAMNDFYIRKLVLKRDGSFILLAEDYTSQASGYENYNRYDNLYGSPYNTFNNAYYTPGYTGYYRPFNSFGSQGTRYYYDNVIVLSVDKAGATLWTDIIHKQQFDDDNDNYLSFNIFNSGGELHFLYNDISKRDKLLSVYVIAPDGSSKRSPTLRTYEQGYEFMPRFAKQIGAREVIIPCTLRNQICFVKVDY